MEAPTSNTYVDETLRSFLEHPWLFLLRLIITICLITRGITGISSRLQSVQTNKPGVSTIPQVPYWIPFIGHQLSFSLRHQMWLPRLPWSSHKHEIYTITLLGRKTHVIASWNLITALQQPETLVTSASYKQLRSRWFFANHSADEVTATRVSTAISSYVKDKSKVEKLCKILEAETYNLISPSKSRIDQAYWERNADVDVLSPVSAKSWELCVAASLPILVQEFASYVILSTLLGSSFLESNPSFVNDLLTFGGKYESFMTGWPYWIMPGLGPPAWAREKCLLALEGLVGAIVADMQNESGGGLSVLYNVDDVHHSLQDLVHQAWRDNDRAAEKMKRSRRAMLRMIACETLEVTWLATYDAANMVLWAILDIFRHADLRTRVCTEASKILQVEKAKSTGLPIDDPPKLNFKIKGRSYFHDIEHSCSDLNGILQLNERIRTWPEAFLDVSEDFILHAIDDDKTSAEKETADQQQQQRQQQIGRTGFQLKRGDRLYVAYRIGTHELRQWKWPDDLADKFSEIESETELSSRIGNTDRKAFVGQLEQIHYIVAAVVSMYNFEALDGGPLSESSSTIVAGMEVPSGSFRAKILRRPL